MQTGGILGSIKAVLGVTLLVATAHANSAASLFDQEKLSVIAISQNPEYTRYEKTVRSAFESVLEDNAFMVLDVDKSKELRNNWDQLSDPSSLVTAEDFIERAGQFAIDGVVTLYFDVEVREVLTGYYSATAVVTSRLVSDEADVKGSVPKPMGSLGYAPSDGLTASAAIVNALRREVDRVSETFELELLAPQNPRFLDIKLTPATLPAGARALDALGPLDASLQKSLLAAEGKKTGIRRTPSCSRRASDSVGAMGVYTRDMDLRMGPSYGSSLALVDLDERRIVNELVFHQINRSAARQGSAEIEDCLFFNGWRFFFGYAERGIKLFDLEKGKAVAEVKPPKISSPKLTLYRAGEATYLRAAGGGNELVLEISVDR